MFPCPVCDKTFEKAFYMEQHVRRSGDQAHRQYVENQGQPEPEALDPADDPGDGDEDVGGRDPEQLLAPADDERAASPPDMNGMADNDNSDGETRNHCGDCGESFTGQPENCPGCDGELNWDSAVTIET